MSARRELRTSEDLKSLDFGKGSGLVTVVAQDASSGVVLMVAHADREALETTLLTNEMHYRSRARGPWHKGGTSGNVQRVSALYADCDGDAVLALVFPAGPSCHTGEATCFGQPAPCSDALRELDEVILSRAGEMPSTSTSYTHRLLSDRNLRLKKLTEEAGELAVACADGDREQAIEEAADLIYHVLVALRAAGAGLTDLIGALARRSASGPATGNGRQ
ncbi:MAG: phosphoribosyl-ATP diphosphatase [Gemmatimonadaceae bacterium]